ncbi:hypothetical protein H7X65_02160 [Candidatus Parcubacteria bacterium]|nr:hypothetical protein [Candidatus Parcubacteria bacterium]
MSFFSKIFLLLIFVFSFSINTFAATGPEDIAELKEKVYYNVSPLKPNIGDTVQIEVEMPGTAIKDSNFIWKFAGKTFKEGVGANKVNFVLSQKTKVDLAITTGAGVTIQKSFDFDPKKVVIIWESKTFTPPFFKGKSLYVKESSIVLNAINLDQENPLTNVYNNYTWKVDTTVKGNDSGVGYSSYVYQGDILGLEPLFTVTMTGIRSAKDRAANKTASTGGQSILRVQAFPTEIISYEKLPLLGTLFNKTIKSPYYLDKGETTLVAYPMHYALSSSLAGTYEWFINDVKINTSLNELSFKKKKDNEQSRLTVGIKNEASILQTRNMSYIIDTNKK